MTGLSVRALAAGYADAPVVRDVSFEVEAGQTLSVVGPSGCGKTTLLLCVAGLLEPSAGRVLMGGIDITQTAPERRGIVLLHQENTLFPHLNVQENVAFGLRIRGQSRSERTRRADELLAMVNLERFNHRAVDELSGGEKQRVALARALAVDPKVLLLDEPLTALDRSLRIRLREDLRRLLQDLDVTSLYVTHDQEEAAWIGDEMMLMDAGSVVDRGPPKRLHRSPANKTAARLLGRRNLYPYTRQDDGRLRTPLGDLETSEDAPSAGTVLLRDEELRLLGEHEEGIQATVTERRDLGTHVALRLNIGQGRIVMDVPAHDDPGPQATVWVRIPPTAVHAMQDPPDVP